MGFKTMRCRYEMSVYSVYHTFPFRQHEMRATRHFSSSQQRARSRRQVSPASRGYSRRCHVQRGMHPVKSMKTCEVKGPFGLLTNSKHPENVGWVCPDVERDSQDNQKHVTSLQRVCQFGALKPFILIHFGGTIATCANVCPLRLIHWMGVNKEDGEIDVQN